MPFLAVTGTKIVLKHAKKVRRIVVHFAALPVTLVLLPDSIVEGPVTARERSVAVSLSSQLVDFALVDAAVMVLDIRAILTQDLSRTHVYLRLSGHGCRDRGGWLLLLLLLFCLLAIDSFIFDNFCPQFLVLRRAKTYVQH